MGFDVGSIPEHTLREISYGLSSEAESFADLVCRKVTDRTTLSGKVPVMTSTFTLAQDINGGLEPLEQARPHLGSMTTVDYDCKAYVGSSLISDEERNDLAAYGLERIGQAAVMARADANLGLDKDLEAALLSTSLNTEFDVTSDGNGAWDDYTNGTPIQDMIKAKRTDCPEADTLILGLRAYEVVIGHPDIVAETSHFSGGSLDWNALEAYLRRKVPGIRNVFTSMKLYDNAAYGATASFDFLFEEGVWMGKQADLLLVAPENADVQDKLEVDRVVDRRAHRVQYSRYADIVRPTQAHASIFTNLFT